MQENTVEVKSDVNPVNPDLTKELEKDSPMKEWLIDYVGNKLSPEDDEVNLAMIIETMADEFPEFLLSLAEENWIRGYHQAINDMETGKKLYEEEIKSKKQKKEFLLFSRIMVFIQDPLISDSVDFDEVVNSLEKFMPPHLFEDIDIIYVGQYQNLIDRSLEALYESGAIYKTL